MFIESVIMHLQLLLDFGKVLVEFSEQAVDLRPAIVFGVSLGFFIELDDLFKTIHRNFSVVIEVHHFHLETVV